MMDSEIATFKWGKVKNGRFCFAVMDIEVIPNPNNESQIIECYSGKGFENQGYAEEVSKNGYGSWKIAARQGLMYAFSLTTSYWTVKIHQILGRAFLETNPSVVGYVAIRAFCEKAHIVMDETKIQALENFVFSSWADYRKELIPDFFSLTFKEYSG